MPCFVLDFNYRCIVRHKRSIIGYNSLFLLKFFFYLKTVMKNFALGHCILSPRSCVAVAIIYATFLISVGRTDLGRLSVQFCSWGSNKQLAAPVSVCLHRAPFVHHC